MASDGNYAKDLERFTAIAVRYCEVVDAAANLQKVQLLAQIYRILPELVGEGIRLPDTDPFERDKDEADDDSPLPPMREGITYQECAVVYNLLKEKLGEDDLYWTVFDPTKDNEVIRGTLADDIAGIYGDVKQGLLTLKKGAADSRLIIWDWRLSLYSHWGDHATSALRTIHALLREKFEDGQSI